VHTGFWQGDLKQRDHLEDLGVDGRIMLKWIFKSGMEDLDCTDLVQDRDRWHTLVNAVMNLRVP
jgi:hypothetical protein